MTQPKDQIPCLQRLWIFHIHDKEKTDVLSASFVSVFTKKCDSPIPHIHNKHYKPISECNVTNT